MAKCYDFPDFLQSRFGGFNDSSYRVKETHKKTGSYLSPMLNDMGIFGSMPGATRIWLFNTYGMTAKQAWYLADAFIAVARENGLAVTP